MTDYKKALDKAVDYIMNSAEDYCQICVNFEPCNKQLNEYGKQGIDHEVDRNLCKDSVRQHFIREAEADNGSN